MAHAIRLEALEVLDAIDRHGSFAAAAASLYRVPSAISYTIGQLETELGITVFDRSGHRAILTPAGRLLLDEGRRILAATQELAAAARRQADHWEAELRIAIDGLIPPAKLASVIAAFETTHPAINLSISEEILAGTWEALVEERVDLAIGVAEAPASAGVHQRFYKNIEFGFCCAPSHPLAQSTHALAEDDIRVWRGIVVADTARRFSPRSSDGLLDAQPKLTVSSMHSKRQAIIDGLGVGYCPIDWIAADLAAGRLIAPPMAVERAAIATSILWRRDGHGRALRWFVDRLTQPNLATSKHYDRLD